MSPSLLLPASLCRREVRSYSHFKTIYTSHKVAVYSIYMTAANGLTLLMVSLLSISIFALVNVGYVIASSSHLVSLFLLQYSVALFHATLTDYAVYPVVDNLKKYQFISEAQFIYSFVFIKLTCSVIVLVVATICTDPLCFRDYIFPLPDISVSFQYPYCNGNIFNVYWDFSCAQTVKITEVSVFTPTFTYR